LKIHVKVEIWSDVVCPWCFIGKRRFEQAVESFPHPVEVVYRSFELDPSAPVGGAETATASLAQKYGGEERVAVMQQHVAQLADEVGLHLRLDETLHANTVDAHRLLHLALDRGGPTAQQALQDAMLAAYFEDVRDVSDHGVLREVALGAGLDAAEVDDVLAGDGYRDAVSADIQKARAYGAGGVPLFVFEEAYAVSGAQPTEVFAQVLEQVWEATRPALVTLGGVEGEVCGPEGCD
jgi:predicted DsbA family dithiol-disulfide isomerase